MKKPQILIDDEIFIRQRFGGVSRIFIEILKACHLFENAAFTFSNLYSENEYLQQAGLSKTKPYLKNYRFPLKGKLTRFLFGNLSHFQTNRKLKSGNITIFHPSFYSNYFFSALPNSTKLVFTLHDLTHEKNNDALANIKKQNLERANHIIVVSGQTKKEMEEYYPFTKNKSVSVIHLAQNLPEQSSPIKNLPNSFILFVGERSHYKNFNTLLNAFVRLSEEFPDLNLVCCGGQKLSGKERKNISSLNLTQKVFHYNLNDAELMFAYQNAKIFVYPSFNEGFGIPTLEAMKCLTPTILSDIPVFREVANDAALYFNPKDEKELASKIKLILASTLVQTELKNKATNRIAQFSWKHHLQKTFEVYQSLL